MLSVFQRCAAQVRATGSEQMSLFLIDIGQVHTLLAAPLATGSCGFRRCGADWRWRLHRGGRGCCFHGKVDGPKYNQRLFFAFASARGLHLSHLKLMLASCDARKLAMPDSLCTRRRCHGWAVIQENRYD